MQDVCISDPVPLYPIEIASVVGVDVREQHADTLPLENIALRILCAMAAHGDHENRTAHSMVAEAFDVATAFKRRCEINRTAKTEPTEPEPQE